MLFKLKGSARITELKVDMKVDDVLKSCGMRFKINFPLRLRDFS